MIDKLAKGGFIKPNKRMQLVGSYYVTVKDEYICLVCGKIELRSRPKFLPLPNPSISGKESMMNCLLGIHTFVPKVKVILNDT